MASITDNKGDTWEIKFTLRTMSKIFRNMNCTLAMLTKLELPVADFIDSLEFICEKQIKERGLTIEEFYERTENVSPGVIIAAINEGIASSFPQQSDQSVKGQDPSAPFAPGSGTTS